MVMEKTRDALFTGLYQKAFPAVARYVSARGGSLEGARETFQEGLVQYYEKVLITGFEPDSGHKKYLIGVCKNLWLKNSHNGLKIQSDDDLDIADPDHEPAVVTRKLLQALQMAGQKCLDLLQSFYYEKLPMKTLANRFGYTSERSATVQKYKCLEKVRDEVKQKSLSYEDFLN